MKRLPHPKRLLGLILVLELVLNPLLYFALKSAHNSIAAVLALFVAIGYLGLGLLA